MIRVYSNDGFLNGWSKFSVSFTKDIPCALSRMEPTYPVTQCEVYIYIYILLKYHFIRLTIVFFKKNLF